jgi:acyl-CoA reductase-like NAD-dependent aldehyde dehydrogenase
VGSLMMKQYGTWYMKHLIEACSILSGKTCFDVPFYQDDVAGCFEFFAGLAEALDKKQNSLVPLPENFKCHLQRDPIGVVGLITPWYFFPFLTAVLLYMQHLL